MMRLNKTLNNVNTPILTWGNPFEANGKEVIICVTGNPGISDFYIEFAEELHKTLNLPVIVVGQAGHEFSVDNEAISEKNKDLYNLQGQLKHKLDLIENYVDKKTYDEMDNVRSLNNEAIQKITKKCNVIYSCNDGWAPLDYMADIKKQHPHLRMVEAANVAHSFVLKSSQLVAEMVSNYIKEQK
ncbi:unnamed protein product [Danaus chrysippus]|uniref:Lipid droplet-associated hydrolase n=1 Tax=Danaus chrysippus TaxID=151541 RepID=A0A8J2RH28_9NEOP|nr:unnamed protein product [Danaus chrysippus]